MKKTKHLSHKRSQMKRNRHLARRKWRKEQVKIERIMAMKESQRIMKEAVEKVKDHMEGQSKSSSIVIEPANSTTVPEVIREVTNKTNQTI